MSRPRALTAEERRLWAAVVREIAPLGGRRTPPAEPEPEPPPRPAPERTGPAPRAPRPSAIPAAKPLAPLERRTRTALRRGAARPDAVLDLHGMRQAEAHAALVGFLGRARSAGHGLVLVVTGKGGAGDDPFAERGVLRRSVPLWLALPSLRALVLGFEEADTRRGGAGALYVRLRRRA